MKKKVIAILGICICFGIGTVLLYRFARIGVESLIALFHQQSAHYAFKGFFEGMFRDKWVLLAFLIGFCVGILIYAGRAAVRKIQGYYDAERNFSYSKKGTFGTSTFMTEEEFNSKLKSTGLEETDEIIFGTLER